jgi:cellobiose-specific phosphotransferase system component IIB
MVLWHATSTRPLRVSTDTLNPGFRLGARVEVIIQYLVRPGHAQEFEDLVNLYTEGYKGVPGMHWGTYEETYGSPGNAFLVIVTHKSAAELDAEEDNDKKFAEALGQERLKKLALLEASCVESKQADVFFIDPQMRYPTKQMRKADPEFWNPWGTATR